MLLLRVLNGDRMTSHEGIHADRQGRPEDAVRLWQATMDLGRLLQASADTPGDFQLGLSLEQAGAQPAWQLYPKEHRDMSDEQRRRRSFWYGSQHALYVDQVGEEADAALRDRLVVNQARFYALATPFCAHSMQTDATIYLHTFMLLALTTGVLVVLFGIVSLCGREAADNATTIRPGWRAALILAALPLGRFFFLVWEPDSTCLWLGPGRPPLAVTVWGAAATIPLAVLFLSLLSILYRHHGPATTWTVWRGNIRALLPATTALVALVCVALGLHAALLRAKATREPRRSELVRAIDHLGPAWTDPWIPLDSWRAEYPPEPPSEHP
jgi:hypothetical protein